MPETERKSPRKPSVKVGDIVFAEGRFWYVVTSKVGQRCKGYILGASNRSEYQFTTRSVERVFRELGKTTRSSGQDDR